MLLVATIAVPVGFVTMSSAIRVELPEQNTADALPLETPRDREPTLSPLTEWSSVWQRPVHPPAAPDPSEAVVKVEPRVEPQPPAPPFRVTLLATAIESDGKEVVSRAVLLNADNQVVVKRVGDITSGARVLWIEAYRVAFDHSGREVVLELPGAEKNRAGPTSAWKDRP